MREPREDTVLFICEKYYLRFYRPLAKALARSGFHPIWITLDGADRWDFQYVDPGPAVDELVEATDLTCREDIDVSCVFERAVFDRPNLFKANYPYTLNVVRTPERARRIAEVWHRVMSALVVRFEPRGVFTWNGRYLPYSAVSRACQALEQLLFTSEIGWIPGTIFLDRGPLSTDLTDLRGRGFESADSPDGRADAFLRDYTSSKATMVSQPLASRSEVRQRVAAGDDRTFLVLYGCQVDWDTNIVIGARRFKSNEAAVSFLMACLSAIPQARLVVKTHPLDSEKNEDALRAVVGDRGTVISDIHPHALIDAADCVAVRNSTLGFEALCYGKPLIALEDAKYNHPQLTLLARNVEEGAANLGSVCNKTCAVPDPLALRQFILHLLDRYLLPVGYEYFFAPAQLGLLSHFARSGSYAALEQLLREARRPKVEADVRVLTALAGCEARRPPQSSFLGRQIRRLSEWMS